MKGDKGCVFCGGFGFAEVRRKLGEKQDGAMRLQSVVCIYNRAYKCKAVVGSDLIPEDAKEEKLEKV